MRYLVKLVIRTHCLDTVECCFGSSVLCASLLYVSIYFIIMVALCNRAVHYIVILFLLSSFSSFFFFPRLISAVGDWMFTILWHMVWP